MLIGDYCDFVVRSDWTRSHSAAERTKIAQYGIAAETGSLVSAVKKKLLGHGASEWDVPNDEITEELGDIVWYTSMLASLENKRCLTDILRFDLTALPQEIDKDEQFKAALDEADYSRFISGAREYIKSTSDKEFREYQELAFLTSRTKGKELLHVCLTRLSFYSTVLMSKGFPQVEKLMQRDILDLPLERTLGMIMWHIAAVSTLYRTSLDDIAEQNRIKLTQLYNINGAPPTALHDDREGVPESQKLPRKFDVSFVTVGPGRLQMYLEGSRLGDELTDNSRKDDGYRFHDIMHLANAARLGWSPVLRSLMKRKRKYDPEIDSSEDGARAQIVEEAVVKAIHSEGERIGGGGAYRENGRSATLFTSKEQIPFSFLKLIKSFVKGLEVEINQFWEWQEAIVDGHRIYAALHREGQGTVRVDLEKRSMSFEPTVVPALKGAVVGTGIGQANPDDIGVASLGGLVVNRFECGSQGLARSIAQKKAILSALGLAPDDEECRANLMVTDLPGGEVSIKASGMVQEAIWRKGAISFQTVDIATNDTVLCYAIALGDISR